jgi:hypothetical protein
VLVFSIRTILSSWHMSDDRARVLVCYAGFIAAIAEHAKLEVLLVGGTLTYEQTYFVELASMKFEGRKDIMKRLSKVVGIACSLILAIGIQNAHAQKGSGTGTGSTSTGAGNSAGGGGSQGAGAQGVSSSGATPASRIEATMLAYEASDKISAHISDQIKGHTIYVYDSQTFASIQSYEAYSVTVGAFEMSFRLYTTAPPGSSFVTATGGIQSIVSSLAAMRSTAEYAADTVNFQTDPLIAQVANQLSTQNTKVIVPKFLFLSPNDLKSSGTITKTGCSDIAKTIPDQLGCLLLVRNDALVAAQAGTPSQQAAFADLDKLFQVFFSTMMGTSVNLSSNISSPSPVGGGGGAAPAVGGGGGAAPAIGGGGAPTGTSPGAPSQGNQSTTVPLLSQIIQGHRLESQFNSDSNSRILVLEATEAGGGSRIKHIFFGELFWTTPTPTFTGGAIVTYLLLDPSTSTVEKSEVLRFTVDYGKFHGKKIQTASNFK